MSLRTRISVALILASMMTAILVLAGSIWIISGIINRANERELQGQYSALVSRLELESRQGAAVSSVVAQIPAVQEAMASADRAVLLAMFGSGFAALKSAYGVDQFQFRGRRSFSSAPVRIAARRCCDTAAAHHDDKYTNSAIPACCVGSRT